MNSDINKKMNMPNKYFASILLIFLCLLFPQINHAALKQLYFDNLNFTTGDLTRLSPGVSSTDLNQGDIVTIDQTPVFQAPFTISGGTTANIFLSLKKVGGGGTRTVQVDLYNGITGTLIGSNSWSWSAGGPQYPALPITIATDENFAINDFIRIVVLNSSVTNVKFSLQASAGSDISQLQMQTNTVINLDSVAVYANAYPDPTEYMSYVAGTTVYLRAIVSDPFGTADISSVDFTVNDPAPAQVFTTNITLPITTLDGATAVFETPYVIPATPDGIWSVDFTANEGAEGTVTASASVALNVGAPILNVKKTSVTVFDPVNINTLPKAIPNSLIEYTVEISNTGFGYADNNSVIITDPLASTQTTFYFGVPPDPAQFIDGAIASGLTFSFIDLASITDDIQFSNDGGATFVTPTADPVTGYDTTAPKINYIEINPKGDFRGSDGTNNPSMQINFRVKVD